MDYIFIFKTIFQNNVLKNVTRVVSEEPKELKPKSATGAGGAARGPLGGPKGGATPPAGPAAPPEVGGPSPEGSGGGEEGPRAPQAGGVAPRRSCGAPPQGGARARRAPAAPRPYGSGGLENGNSKPKEVKTKKTRGNNNRFKKLNEGTEIRIKIYKCFLLIVHFK